MKLWAFLDQILFVIVLYKRKPEESPAFTTVIRLREITSNPVSIFIYDNSPEPNSINYPGVIYRYDRENNGVSKAYNETSLCASGLSKKWMLLLDQDTIPNIEFFSKALDTILKNPPAAALVPTLFDKRGIVSPFRWSMGKGKRIKAIKTELPLEEYRFANSGLLIRLDAFNDVCGYDESIRLDFSDIAFGESLRQITKTFTVVDSTWKHSFSGSLKHHYKDASLRFDFFCSGSFRLSETTGLSHILFIRALLRSLKLTLHYKRPTFIKIFFKHALHG